MAINIEEKRAQLGNEVFLSDAQQKILIRSHKLGFREKIFGNVLGNEEKFRKNFLATMSTYKQLPHPEFGDSHPETVARYVGEKIVLPVEGVLNVWGGDSEAFVLLYDINAGAKAIPVYFALAMGRLRGNLTQEIEEGIEGKNYDLWLKERIVSEGVLLRDNQLIREDMGREALFAEQQLRQDETGTGFQLVDALETRALSDPASILTYGVTDPTYPSFFREGVNMAAHAYKRIYILTASQSTTS